MECVMVDNQPALLVPAALCVPHNDVCESVNTNSHKYHCTQHTKQQGQAVGKVCKLTAICVILRVECAHLVLSLQCQLLHM